MTSLRGRLFAILLAATGLIWLSAVIWVYAGTKAELEHVLDTRLQEAARMVNSLVATADMAAGGTVLPSLQLDAANYERQLSCQIWSIDGRLMARSSGAPDGRLTEVTSGFSDRVVDGESWRVYAIENSATGARVMVGDRLGLRDRLVADLIKGVLAPALLTVPLLGLMIWLCLGRGLLPLRTMAGELRKRDADDMSPIATGDAPAEVRPLIAALNGLFGKVDAARRHEREVTAFAAHELRTPLAGLKTQAQIALAAPDAAVRNGALQQIIVSVDRTARLMRQLLVLAKLDAGEMPDGGETVNVGHLLDEIAAAATSNGAHIEIDASLHGRDIRADRELLTLALRNLHENAVQHMSAGGTVRWRAASGKVGFEVEDEGPGIPEEELPFVTRRFFRGRHKSAVGTGLGLAIADAAARRLGGTLVLANRDDRSGVRATLTLPQTASVPLRP
ncbi:ATP-binding protein [Bosea lathyri]|uniref:histidine kinase n=1 Tax=Bosea lathyri TaxID=1036778 RepID=A0A1H5UWG9_9HYPH|nr:ATP-binding protein [Bosea lathyri]SEF79363.1 two-component system, OmpR family, sensor histidine kinase QseC [Bosea lathyri]